MTVAHRGRPWPSHTHTAGITSLTSAHTTHAHVRTHRLTSRVTAQENPRRGR